MTREVEEFVNHVERLVCRRDSRLPMRPLTTLECEAVLTWDAAVAAHERAHRAQVTEMYGAVVSIMKGMAGG